MGMRDLMVSELCITCQFSPAFPANWPCCCMNTCHTDFRKSLHIRNHDNLIPSSNIFPTHYVWYVWWLKHMCWRPREESALFQMAQDMRIEEDHRNDDSLMAEMNLAGTPNSVPGLDHILSENERLHTEKWECGESRFRLNGLVAMGSSE